MDSIQQIYATNVNSIIQWRRQNISLGGAHFPNHDKEINKIMYKHIITPVSKIPVVILQKSDAE